jgi:hypothetical protein
MVSLTISNLGYRYYVIMTFIHLYILRKGVKYWVLFMHIVCFIMYFVSLRIGLFCKCQFQQSCNIFVLMFLNGYLSYNDFWHFAIHYEELWILQYSMDHQISWFLFFLNVFLVGWNLNLKYSMFEGFLK